MIRRAIVTTLGALAIVATTAVTAVADTGWSW